MNYTSTRQLEASGECVAECSVQSACWVQRSVLCTECQQVTEL